MTAPKNSPLPSRLRGTWAVPRNYEERLRWIKKRVATGYYDSTRVREAPAAALTDALLDSDAVRRARK